MPLPNNITYAPSMLYRFDMDNKRDGAVNLLPTVMCSSNGALILIMASTTTATVTTTVLLLNMTSSSKHSVLGLSVPGNRSDV